MMETGKWHLKRKSSSIIFGGKIKLNMRTKIDVIEIIQETKLLALFVTYLV